jgi:type II restriction enzyme
MKKLTQLLNLSSDDELFAYITSSFKEKITRWDYFVNWPKVINNVELFEKELNVLNYLIGKDDIEKEAIDLFKEYPNAIKAIPSLLAVREGSIDILIDSKNFEYKHINFNKVDYTLEEIEIIANCLNETGIGELLKNKQIKNLVDYTTGVEVGLDSNGRKNRGGTMMENIVETMGG